MSQRAVFVSDLHLTGPEDPKTQLFAHFLKSLLESDATRPSALFLVGDIFDLWVGDHEFFTSRFKTIVTAVSSLIRAGVEVHYFEGNHDLHLTKFWATEIGAKVHKESGEFRIGSLNVRVEHGDLINPEDHGYLFLRRLLRSAPVRFLSMNLPEVAVGFIGERASRASRNYTSTAKSKPSESIRALIRSHAKKQNAVSPFDIIVTGHVHVADDYSFTEGGRQIRSINLGSWYESPPRALVIDDGGIRFETVADSH